MKKSIRLFCIVVFTIYGVNAFCQKKPFLPKKIIFEQSFKADGSGIDQFNDLIDSAARSADDYEGKDSLAEGLKNLSKEFFSEISDKRSETVLEILKDTIWRYTRIDGEINGDYERVGRNGIIHFYAKGNRKLKYKTFDAFKKVQAGKITINKKVFKQILGFRCYKVTIKVPPERGNNDLGDNVYEMYVTDLIELPLHSIIYVNKNYPFFPLEIKRYMTNMPGMAEYFKAVSIER